jgi:hypothetical protein
MYMSKVIRGSGASVLLLLAAAGASAAQEPKSYAKHDMSALYNSLRDVINQGAKIFNEQGDHAGCYRIYQGSLMTVRPFLAPELQKQVDDSLAAAEKLPSFAERAFELRKALDAIRAQTKPLGATTTNVDKKEPKTTAPTKTEDKKPDEPKKPLDTKPAPNTKTPDTGIKNELKGKLSLTGQAVPGGYFVTLVDEKNREKRFSTAVQKDGSFRFGTAIKPGTYLVAIEPIPGEKGNVPERYFKESSDPNGLQVVVQGGPQFLLLDLVK